MASFKMVEKTKYKKMFDIQEFNARRVDQETITGRERRDAYGNIIKKKNRKKIKVSFIDQINEEQPLVNVVDIESYKKYNFIIGMPKEDHIKKNQVTSNCQCCIMFWHYDYCLLFFFVLLIIFSFVIELIYPIIIFWV